MIVELDLVSQDSISAAFATIRREAGDPDVLVYNAGYLEGRELPPEKELLEHIPVEMFDTAQHISSRGPFLVAKEVLPSMRKKGQGSFFISQQLQLAARAQANDRTVALLSQGHDAHAGAGTHRGVLRARRARGQRGDRRSIDSPGTRALPMAQKRPDIVMNPVKIAEAFYYLHTQDRSCWTHELQLTHFRPSRATDIASPGSLSNHAAEAMLVASSADERCIPTRPQFTPAPRAVLHAAPRDCGVWHNASEMTTE